VSVFLRWGIFGILGVAALLYAYNATKRMAERHAQQSPPVAQSTTAATADVPSPAPISTPAPAATPPPAERGPPAPAHCEAELVVAQRALQARKNGDPLDRLLRIQEIAFEDLPVRRQRLETVATRYYNYEGDFNPDALRIAVISDCVMHSPDPKATPAG
jgi:hypothetical protein